MNTRLIVALAAILMAAGCVSIDRCDASVFPNLTIDGSNLRAREHIVVSNFGYYIFNTFPLICGNANPRRILPFKLFSSHVSLPYMQAILSHEAKKRGHVKIASLTSHYDAAPCFTISTDAMSILGMLFSYREVQLSAVLMDDEAPSSEVDP